MKYVMAFFSVMYSLIGQTKGLFAEKKVSHSSEKQPGVRENDRRSYTNNSRADFEQLNKVKTVESVQALNCTGNGNCDSKR